MISPDGVIVVHARTWLLYDSRADRWQRLPMPPEEVPQPTIVVVGGQLFALDVYVDEGGGAPVQALDLQTMRWSVLPASTGRPRLDQRTLVATPQGLVVMGDDLSPRQAGESAENAHAELWDGARWRRFPDSPVQGMAWLWTGDRIISGYRVTQDSSARGGLHEFRAGALDPSTGTWSALPWLPDPQPGLIEATASDGALVLSEGFLYDDATRSSRAIPRQPGRGLGSAATVLGRGSVMSFGGFRSVPGQSPGLAPTEVIPTDEVWLLPLDG